MAKCEMKFGCFVLCTLFCPLAGFFHSFAEEFNKKTSFLGFTSRVYSRRANELIKRLAGRGQALRRTPETWSQLESYMRPSSSPGYSHFAGAYSVVEQLAKEFRSRFLNRSTQVPYIVEPLLIMMGVMWVQGHLQTFSFDDPRTSMAKKTLLLCFTLHGRSWGLSAVALSLTGALA